MKFGEVVRLVSERCDPTSSGLDRFVGLEHIEPGDLRVRSWGNVGDGTTFTNRFRSGHVLFGKRRAYQRKVAVADFDGVCSGDIYVFESADAQELLPDLLPLLCQTNSFFDYAVGTSAGSLSPRTNWASLANYEFALPPLEEQFRIVRAGLAISTVVDAGACLLRAAHSCLSALDDTFLSSAFSKYPLHPFATLCDFFSRRHDADTQKYDAERTSVGAVPVLRSLNVWPGRFDVTELRYMSAQGNDIHKRLQIKAGDLLLVRTGDAGRPGNAAVVEASMDGWNCLDLILARPIGLAKPHYLAAVINQPSVLQLLTGLSPGTKQKHLTMTELHRINVPIPPEDVQETFISHRNQMAAAVKSAALRVRAARRHAKMILGVMDERL